MKIVNAEEGLTLLRSKLPGDVSIRSIKDRLKYRASFLVPGDAGKKTALARRLSDSLVYVAEGVLWIDGHSVWPSSENMHLFEAYRKSLGELRTLTEAPFHVFRDGDSPSVECLLDLSLYFSWDVLVLEGGGNRAIRLSHDEYIDLCATDKEGVERFREAVFGLELKEIGSQPK